jgi:hypothetical protein
MGMARGVGGRLRRRGMRRQEITGLLHRYGFRLTARLRGRLNAPRATRQTDYGVAGG